MAAVLAVLTLATPAQARKHFKHHKECHTLACARHADRAYAKRHRPCPPIMAFLTKPRRLTPSQAAGVVGNIMQESGGDPYASGGGLTQGQGARDHTGPLVPQLRAIWDELRGPERSTLLALRRTRSPEQAARVFSEMFERPSLPNMPAREAYARDALESFPRWCHNRKRGPR